MIERVRQFCLKHRELLVYVIVGGLTTLVSWGCKFLWNAVFYGNTATPTVVQNTVRPPAWSTLPWAVSFPLGAAAAR